MSKFTSIYIHWPFCKSKCPYCDFNSHVRDTIDIDSFLSAYLKEIEYFTSYLEGKIIKSIFFGGGTPSLAPIKLVDSVINKLNRISKFSDEIEISLEANPTSVEMQKFKGLSEVGVNRISIGVQSFDETELKFLGREHSAKEAIQAIEIANKYFSNYSFDLMYTLPNQRLENWCRALEKAMFYVNNHISLYQLTIEKGTKFFSDHRAKRIIMPEDDISKEFYETTRGICEEYGLNFYEISNYAKKGYESKHNMNYWLGNEYMGVGPGAHGRVMFLDKRYETIMYYIPERWLEAVKKNGVGYQKCTVMSKEDILKEKIMMSLRMKNGIEKKYLPESKLQELITLGLMEKTEKRARCTNKGMLVLNSVIHFLSC